MYLVLGLGWAGLGHLGNGSAPKISVAWFFGRRGGGGLREAVKHGIDRTDVTRGPTLLLSHLESVPRLSFWHQFLDPFSPFKLACFYLPPPSIFEEGVLPRRHHIKNSFSSFLTFWLLHQKKNKIVGRTITPVQRQPHSNSLTTVPRHSLQQATSLLCDRVGFFPALVSVSIATSTGMPGRAWQRAAISKMSSKG